MLFKRIVIVAVTVFFGVVLGEASAQVTKAGHVACKKKVWMEELLSFIKERRKLKAKQYVENGRCIFLVAGEKITITDPPGIFGSYAGFKMEGVKYWAYKDSIDFRKKN